MQPFPMVSGRFYAPPIVIANGDSWIDNGYIFALPIYVPNSVGIASMHVNVAGQPGSFARVGMYTDANGYPDALAFEADNPIDCEGSGDRSVSVTNGSLTEGWHWLACAVTGDTQMHTSQQSETTLRLLGTNTARNALGQTAAQSGIAAAFTYAALPSTFPSGGGLAHAVIGTGCPMIAIEIA